MVVGAYADKNLAFVLYLCLYPKLDMHILKEQTKFEIYPTRRL